MAEFHTNIDIANRALQRIGQERITAFTEDTKRAQEVAFSYGKLRRAELRRNVWRFATRRAPLRPIDTDTMLLAPALWVASTTYFVGSIVQDSEGNYWISRVRDNLNFEPANTPAWELYFGPLTVTPYDADLAYYAGELVYTAEGDGTNRVYLSLESSNEDNPATATDWDATETYHKNVVVTRTAVAYMSLIDLNTGNDPALAPALWDASTSYSIGDEVGGSDGLIYQSVVNSNLGNDPTLDDGTNWTGTGVLNPWTTDFVGGTGSLKWLQIGGEEFPTGVTLIPPYIIYPLGSGPSSQQASRNIFRLPAGYLREAPQDPKAGSHSLLGAPTGLQYSDWLYEGNYLISRDGGVLNYRFVADVSDVEAMDDMFCEGLAARIALETCEQITQSNAKINNLAQIYRQFMTEARAVNGIETGPVEPAEDDFITTRA